MSSGEWFCLLAIGLMFPYTGCVSFPQHEIVTLSEVKQGERIEREVRLPSDHGWPLSVEPKGRRKIRDADRNVWENLWVTVYVENLSDVVLPAKTWAFLADGKGWEPGDTRPESRLFDLEKGEDAIVFRGPLIRLARYGTGVVVGRNLPENAEEFYVRIVLEFENEGSFGRDVRVRFLFPWM